MHPMPNIRLVAIYGHNYENRTVIGFNDDGEALVIGKHGPTPSK